MGENGAEKCNQEASFPSMEVSIELGHQQQPQGGSKFYDEDGRLKRTGKNPNFALLLLSEPRILHVSE